MFLAAAFAMMVPLAAPDAPTGDIARASSTFPTEVIRKGETEHEWPFSIDEGELTCVQMGQPRYVFFAEILTPEEIGTFGNMKLPRSVVVSANPFTYMATIENSELYAPFDTLETLVKRLAPFERMGWALCDAAAKAKDR